MVFIQASSYYILCLKSQYRTFYETINIGSVFNNDYKTLPTKRGFFYFQESLNSGIMNFMQQCPRQKDIADNYNQPQQGYNDSQYDDDIPF